MYIKSKIIVLNKIKYKESDLIVRSYTLHRGSVSYLVKGALKSTKKTKSKSVYFQPLMQLNVEENYRPNQSLQFLKDIKPNYVYKTLHTNIYKSAIGLFLSEILTSVLKEEEKNEALYQFLETAFQYLDTEDSFANFHLLFLLKLTRYLGFQPNDDHQEFSFFNLKSAYFQAHSEMPFTISDKNLSIFKALMGIDFDTLSSLKMNSKDRQATLKTLLYYFELHLDGFKIPKSLTILNEVFH